MRILKLVFIMGGIASDFFLFLKIYIYIQSVMISMDLRIFLDYVGIL